MYNKREEEEMHHVKNLKDGGHNWVQIFWHADDLWEEESVNKEKGIG